MTATSEPLVAADQLRRLMRRQAASVAVVTTATGDGRPYGFTATTVTSVSLRPPLVSFCVHRGSSGASAISAAGHVAVHLLGATQADVARTFAERGIDRFARVRWQPGPHGVPLLDDALARMVCRVADRIGAGDHIIVLAEPVRMDYADGPPLLYHDGDYTQLSNVAGQPTTVTGFLP